MPNRLSPTRMMMTGLLLAAVTAIMGCKPDPAPENLVEEPNGLIPELPTERTMDRAAVLTAVAAAASDYAAGIDDRQAQLALDGKRFEFRIPFGCASDPDILDRNLKLAVRPDGKAYEVSAAMNVGLAEVEALFPEQPTETGPGSDNQVATNETVAMTNHIEAAEGFWVTRPWMLSAQCPIAATPAPVPTPDGGGSETSPASASPPPTVGLVQYYGTSDSRVGQRGGKPLSKIETISGLKTAPKEGAIIVLQGRLRHWPNGKVIQCRGDGQAGPPQCLISTTIDRIAFQRVDNGAIIAEWTR